MTTNTILLHSLKEIPSSSAIAAATSRDRRPTPRALRRRHAVSVALGLTVNGMPSVLSTDDVQYFEAKFFLAPRSGTIYVDVDMSILRKRTVGRGFLEEIIVENHSANPKDIDVTSRPGATSPICSRSRTSSRRRANITAA